MYPLAAQLCVAAFIASGPIAPFVILAIDLDGEPSGWTVEVEDVVAHRVLPAKTDAQLVATERLP